MVFFDSSSDFDFASLESCRMLQLFGRHRLHGYGKIVLIDSQKVLQHDVM